MGTKSYNQRRAEQERQRAVRALTDEARRMHLELAAIFEARAGTGNVVEFPSGKAA